MTTTDDRLERYLHDRSTTIDLPHAGVEAITRRARRHRRRRTVAGGGVAAALLAGGVAVALVQPAADEEVGSLGAPAVVDSPLGWSVVPVDRGIGWGSTAVSDGSAVYSLSTAAGPEPEAVAGEPRRLYRSADGTDWDDVGLPEGLYAAGVAAEDGTVYAVGTAAAGGDAPSVELAVSGDGGAGWDTGEVPVDLAGMAEGFPGRVVVTDAEVAAAGDTTVVAVSIVGRVDVGDVIAGEEGLWTQAEGGLVKTYSEVPSCVPDETTTVPAGTGAPDPTAAPTTAPAPPVAADEGWTEPGGDPGCAEGTEIDRPDERRDWADLGLTEEQAALADGRTHLFVAEGGGALEPAEVIDQASYADPSSSRLLAADDGWWLVDQVVSERDAGGFDVSTDVVAWSSPDGSAWTSETLARDEAMLATGVIAGRPVIVGLGQGSEPFTTRVHRVEGPGAVTTVDLDELLGVRDAGVFAAAVGAAGVAVVMSDGGGQDPIEALEVVHSADGIVYGRQPLPEPEPGTRETVNGITITPDAVKVRLNVRDAGDPAGLEPAAAQRLFVGTPEG